MLSGVRQGQSLEQFFKKQVGHLGQSKSNPVGPGIHSDGLPQSTRAQGTLFGVTWS